MHIRWDKVVLFGEGCGRLALLLILSLLILYDPFPQLSYFIILNSIIIIIITTSTVVTINACVRERQGVGGSDLNFG